MPPFLAPPPEDTFDSKEAAMKYAQKWARAERYAVVTHASAKKGRFVYLRCDRGSTYRNTRKLQDDDRQRKVSSSKVDCQFRARIHLTDSGSWELNVQNEAHTDHGPSESCLLHSIQRRFDALTTERVLELARSGSRVRQIVTLLQEQTPPVLVTSRDVSNLIARYQRELLQGRPPAEALLDWLKEQGWPHLEKTVPVSEDANRLEGLLFAHPRGLELMRRFNTVLVIDATYSTNKNRLPLLHFVGFTSSNRSFTAALAFLPNETTITYTWALTALQLLCPTWEPHVQVTDEDAALSAAILNTFPPTVSQVLCQWHIRQNMQKHARRSLLDEQAYELILSDFDEVRDAQTFDQLTEARNAFMEHWEDSHPKLCDYLDEKLSAEHLWVNAYINRHPHMGTRVTSRAEGAHATLKNWLHSRHGSLFVVTQALKNHFVVQQTGISSGLENDRSKILVTLLGDPFFVQVSRTVSRHALNLIKYQDEMSRRPKNRTPAPATPACACILPPTMGLPCFHALARLRAAGKPIPLDFIHPQWRTAAGLLDERVPRLLDPLSPSQRRVANEAAAATTSSGRILTGNEAEQQVHTRRSRRCKNCHQTGHNSSKCPLPCGRCQGDHQLGQCPH